MESTSIKRVSEDSESIVTESDSKRIRSETSDSSNDPELSNEKLTKLTQAYRTILECVGEDPSRPGLEKTPLRAAKALQFFTSGYCKTVEDVVGEGIFEEETNSDMVFVRNIDIHSLCEHHLVPFTGKVHIAYIPNGKILGLSKLARVANLFSRRLQVQERLTRQIAEAIMSTCGAKGVGVVIESVHMCMVMRGVEQVGSSTLTSAHLGVFETDKDLRKEFLDLVRK